MIFASACLSGAGDGDRDRVRGAVARQPDHPHVVAEVLLPPNWAPDPELPCEFEYFRFHLLIAEAVAQRDPSVGRVSGTSPTRIWRSSGRTLRWDPRRPPQGGRASGSCAEFAQALIQEGGHRLPGLRTALVSWNRKDLFALPPPLAMKSSSYCWHGPPGVGVQLDQGWQVGSGVHLLPHRQGAIWE